VTDTVTLDLEDLEDRELAAVGRYPLSGFEWRSDVNPVDPGVGMGPWLCLREHGPQQIRRYPLLRQRRPLREFVEIAGVPFQSHPEAILQFANHRGWLGQRNARGYMVLVEDQAGERFPAEDFGFWRREAAWLAGLLECNELIPSLSRSQPAAVETYRKLVQDIGANHIVLTYGVEPNSELVSVNLDEMPGRHYSADIMSALVREAVERKLRNSFTLVFRPERLVFMPGTLLEALYLIFAVEMVERRPAAKTCLCGCGEEFYPGRRDHDFVDKRHADRDRQRRRRERLVG
jgi:hypothetical protein